MRGGSSKDEALCCSTEEQGHVRPRSFENMIQLEEGAFKDGRFYTAYGLLASALCLICAINEEHSCHFSAVFSEHTALMRRRTLADTNTQH